MDPGQFFASSKVLIVAGKGGVGKTVLAATCATAATRCGLSALLVEVGGRSAAAPMLGLDDVGYEEVAIGDHGTGSARSARRGVRARSITPDDALVEWLSLHGFKRIINRMARSGLLEVVATATPGIKDLLVLGKIRNLEETAVADVVIVDAPAAGHALGFLRAPRTIADTARSGTIRRQADAALTMLGDASRCRVMLATIPEETPVNELVETAFAVEDEIGVALTPVVVNAVLPALAGLDVDITSSAVSADLDSSTIDDLRAAADLRRGRIATQQEQLATLGDRLPLEQLRLPYLFGTEIGPGQIDELAGTLIEAVDALPADAAP